MNYDEIPWWFPIIGGVVVGGIANMIAGFETDIGLLAICLLILILQQLT